MQPINKCFRLLIVPYGIETMASNDSGRGADELLIVPYGIETIKTHTLQAEAKKAFNCTLWN